MCAAEKGKREHSDTRRACMFWHSKDCTFYWFHFVLTGYEIVVQALIEKSANVNAIDVNRFTPLMYGVGEESIIQLLIDNGANINAKNVNNNSALIIAIKSGNHFEKFSMLMKWFVINIHSQS